MPLPDRSRTAVEQGALFVLGAASFASGPALGRAAGRPWLAFAPLLAVAVVAGLVEAASARRAGRRRWVGSWVPPVLGLLALSVGQLAWERVRGPWHNDSAMAWGIYLAVLAVVVPAFGLLVNAVAWATLRVRPRAEPSPPPP